MLALSLAFLVCSFVRSLPWFSGLILGVGWVRLVWLLGPGKASVGTSTWAWALVGGSRFRTLIGMCGMHGQRRGARIARYCSIYFRLSGEFRLITLKKFLGCEVRGF